MSIVKALKWFFALILALLLLLAVGSWLGSWIFLDKESQYGEAAAALPTFSNDHSSELVQIPAGEWTFRARVAGFDNNKPKGNLILLHGFPESSIMWEPLIKKAAADGYRVVAFDQRGYSPGARPTERDAYSAKNLVSDVLAVADKVGFDTFNLVGHDWGSVVGWQTVFTAPERVESYSALSIPHISAIVESFELEPELRNKSAYMAFYWLPWLPEFSLSADDFSALRQLYNQHPAQHVAEYLAIFQAPGGLTGALNWYRGALEGLNQPTEKVTTPTLFIWGKNDPVTSRLAVELQQNYMAGPFEVIELDSGHWIVESHPEAVTEAVMARIRSTL
tara:strand:+ start:1723 stop:2727 length:1005 start_codon:yes stop_codon:yes gene_type:complete